MENFAPSCERNKHVILEHTAQFFESAKSVLEIGSYSGQHAIFIAEKMPHLNWQVTDRKEHVKKLQTNINNSGVNNIAETHPLDVANSQDWPKQRFDIVYSANTLHIMSWHHVEKMFKKLADCIQDAGHLIIYGPFKYNGEYTSPSNGEFELWLKDRDSQSGIRDFELVDDLAEKAGLILRHDIPD